MDRFIVGRNVKPNGDHEVHNTTEGCVYLPDPINQVELGHHPSCHEAVAEAKHRWPAKKINGCYYCCPHCHVSPQGTKSGGLGRLFRGFR